MNRIPRYLITLIPFLVAVLVGGMVKPTPRQAQAQMEGENSQESIEERDGETSVDIQQLEQEREKKEEQLEETLNIEEPDPNEPKVEEVPDPDEELGLDDNLPYGPTDEETEIKF